MDFKNFHWINEGDAVIEEGRVARVGPKAEVLPQLLGTASAVKNAGSGFATGVVNVTDAVFATPASS